MDFYFWPWGNELLVINRIIDSWNPKKLLPLSFSPSKPLQNPSCFSSQKGLTMPLSWKKWICCFFDLHLLIWEFHLVECYFCFKIDFCILTSTPGTQSNNSLFQQQRGNWLCWEYRKVVFSLNVVIVYAHWKFLF